MKYLYICLVFLALFPSISVSQEMLKVNSKEIASLYDVRARGDKGSGFNTYQKMEYFIDEYNVMRYRITTLYENMDINKAYESYVTNSPGLFFENRHTVLEKCKVTTWPIQLPTTDKTISWHYDEDLACSGVQKNRFWQDNTLEYKYEKPNKLLITYTSYGTEIPKLDNAIFILEFKKEKQGTYLTMTSKALPISFDCKKAGNATEKAICKAAQNDNFDYDIKLHYLYQAFINTASYNSENAGKAQNLITTQKEWLKKRNQCKSDIKCIQSLYESRYKEIASNFKKMYANTYKGFNNCAFIHENDWDGKHGYFMENGLSVKCEFNGNVLETYETIKKMYRKEDRKHFASVEQIKSQQDLYTEVNDPKGGISNLDYKWDNNTLKFTVAYEYSDSTYTISQKDKEHTEILIKEYTAP